MSAKKPRVEINSSSSSSSSSSTSSIPPPESTMLWKEGIGLIASGNVPVRLAQNGFSQQASQIIGLSRTAS